MIIVKKEYILLLFLICAVNTVSKNLTWFSLEATLQYKVSDRKLIFPSYSRFFPWNFLWMSRRCLSVTWVYT